MPTIRPMVPADIAPALRLQAHCYLPDNIESDAVIRARLVSALDAAWVAEFDGAAWGSGRSSWPMR